MAVYKNKSNNSWYVKLKVRNWEGTIKWVTKRGFKHKNEAQKWEREFLDKQSAAPDGSFETFVEKYLADIRSRLKESTMETKENIIANMIMPYFRDKQFRAISALDVLNWQNKLLKEIDEKTGRPYSGDYLHTVHSQLSAIFNHAVRYYKLSENPAKTVGTMGKRKKPSDMNVWSKEEYLRFAEEAMAFPELYYCYELLYWTGMRKGEMKALKRNDFNLKKRTVRITKTYHRKNGQDILTSPKTEESIRTIVLPQFLCDEMAEYFGMCYDLNSDDFIFHTSFSNLQKRMDKIVQKVGLPRIRVHDLRHSHVSLLIDMGYNAVQIGRRLGHTSVEVTFRYAHLFRDAQTNMANNLDSVMEVNKNDE